MRRFLFLLLILFAVGLNVHAQNKKGFLKGIVFEHDTSDVIIGASLKNVSDLSAGAVSDVDGSFFVELTPGVYKFVCSAIYYGNVTFTVTIKENDTTTHNVYLPKNQEVLDQVVVSTSKYAQKLEEQVVSMEVLKPKIIENKNATSIDEAIETVGGVSIIDGDPQIRGGSGFTFGIGSRVQIVVDGMPLLSGDAGQPDWSYIPIENIEQIEIIKGASSVLYGSSAINGVIHVRTAYPTSKPKTRLSVSTGYYSKPKSPAQNWYGDSSYQGFTNINFLHSRKIKSWDLVVGGNLNIDQGYIGPAPAQKYMPKEVKEALNMTDSFPAYSNRDMLMMRGRANINLRRVDPKIKGLTYGVNGNIMYSKTYKAYAWLDDSLGLYRTYPGALFLMNQFLFNVDPFVKYISHNGASHSLITRIFSSNNHITNNQSNSGVLYYGEYQYQDKFKAIDLNFIGGLVANVSTSKAELYATAGLPLNMNQNYAAYIQLDKKFWHILNVSGGVRYEYFQTNNSKSAAKPIVRGGANLQLTKGTFIRASAGQGFRYPTITEQFLLTRAGFFGSYANPDLKPEESYSYEVGVKQGFKIGSFMGYLDVAGFYQHYDNTIEYLFGVWDPTFTLAGFKFLNTGRSRVRGIDASIMGMTDEKKDFRVNFIASYTYVDSKALDPQFRYAEMKLTDNVPTGEYLTYSTTSQDTVGHQLKYRFNHMVKGDIEFAYKKWSIGFSYRYYSKMKNIDKVISDIEYMTETASIFMDVIKYTDYWRKHNGQHIFDARFTYKISDKHKVSLVCNNLFNSSYSLRPLKIEAPRTTSIEYILTL